MPRESPVNAGDPRFVRYLLHWNGIPRRRHGPAGLLRTVAQLQGLPIALSELESSFLPARVADYSPLQLDELLGRGGAVWQGRRSIGRHDGELGLYLSEDFPSLGRISPFAPGEREGLIRDTLATEASLDFNEISARLGGFPEDILSTLWKLAWNGEVTSDSLAALRSRRSATATRYRPRTRPRYTTRPRVIPGSAGRWSLLAGPSFGFEPESRRRLAHARQLLDRYGVACKSTLTGFDDLLPAFETLEAQGDAQRETRLEDQGAQFTAPGSSESWRAAGERGGSVVLSACDPANPFGVLASWPPMVDDYAPARSPGARVFLVDGALVGYLAVRGRGMHTPRDIAEPDPLIRLLRASAADGPVFIESVNGKLPYDTPLHGHLIAAGFSPSRRGYLLRQTGTRGRDG